jgi:hypothetical protein
MSFSSNDFDMQTLRLLRFALETARVRLHVDRNAKEDLARLAEIVANLAKQGFVDVEGLARSAVRSFRDERPGSTRACE